MGKENAFKGNGGKPLGPHVVAFLGRSQQRVQHLDGRLEHFHEFHQPLVGQTQRARVGVGIRVILREVFEFTNIHLADQ